MTCGISHQTFKKLTLLTTFFIKISFLRFCGIILLWFFPHTILLLINLLGWLLFHRLFFKIQIILWSISQFLSFLMPFLLCSPQAEVYTVSTTLLMPMISKAIFLLLLSCLIPNHNLNYLDISQVFPLADIRINLSLLLLLQM